MGTSYEISIFMINIYENNFADISTQILFIFETSEICHEKHQNKNEFLTILLIFYPHMHAFK